VSKQIDGGAPRFGAMVVARFRRWSWWCELSAVVAVTMCKCHSKVSLTCPNTKTTTMVTSNTPTTPSRRPAVQTASNTPTTPSRRPKVQIEVTRLTSTTTTTTERVVWIDSDTEPPTPSPPSSPTRAPSRPQAGVASPSQSVTEAQNILRKPSPEELVEPALPADAYYVVTVGRRTGIFSSWYVFLRHFFLAL
jgi:hypothetical protein